MDTKKEHKNKKPLKPRATVFKMKKKEITPKLIWWGWKTIS